MSNGLLLDSRSPVWESEWHVVPVVCAAERGIQLGFLRTRDCNIIRKTFRQAPTIGYDRRYLFFVISGNILDIAAVVGDGGYVGSLRPFPVFHDLRHHRGHAAADDVAWRKVVLTITTLIPCRLNEVINTEVAVRCCGAEANAALLRRGRLVLRPLGGVLRSNGVIIVACGRRRLRPSRPKPYPTRLDGRTVFGQPSRCSGSDVGLDHRLERVLRRVFNPRAGLRVGEHRLKRGVARGHHEAAAFERHHVVRARATEAGVLAHRRRLCLELIAKRLPGVLPSDDDGCYVVGRDRVRERRERHRRHDCCRDCGANDCLCLHALLPPFYSTKDPRAAVRRACVASRLDAAPVDPQRPFLHMWHIILFSRAARKPPLT